MPSEVRRVSAGRATRRFGVAFLLPVSLLGVVAPAGAAPPCGGTARIGIVAENRSADDAIDVHVTGDLMSEPPPCTGGGAAHYEATLACTGHGRVSCGEVVGLRPGTWVHRLVTTVAGSAPQRQAQRSVVLAGDRTAASNPVRWTIHPRTFVVADPTPAALHAAIAAASDWTAQHDGRALVTFDPVAFPGASDPRRLLLLQPPCALDARLNRCAPDGAVAGLCLAGDRVVVDALDGDGAPGGVVLSVDTCGRDVVRIYGADDVLRGLTIEGSRKPQPTPPCQADALVFTGAGARRSRFEQGLVLGPTCGDGVSVEHDAGQPDEAGAGDVVVATSRIAGAANKGFKVTSDGFGTITGSCVHDNHNGGILATLGGHVVATRNVVQHDVPGSAQHGIAVGGAGGRSTLATDGNVVRFEGARGLSVTNDAQADFRNDYVSDCQFAGSRVETTSDAGADVAPAARFTGVALVCNRHEALTGTCLGAVDDSEERPCTLLDDCCRTAAGDVDASCLATARCGAGSFPLGFGAVTARAADRRAPIVDYGPADTPGRNAFASNRNAAGGANFVASGTVDAIPAEGNQWEHCGSGATCDVAAVAAQDLGSGSGPVVLGDGLAPRAEAPRIDEVIPGRPTAGDLVRIVGAGFNAVEGNPGFQGGAPNCNDLPTCAADVPCATGPCVDGTCPCSIDSPAVERRNQQTDANRLIIRTPTGAVLRTLYPDAVTPTMLVFRMPFDCFAPLVLEVSKRSPAGTRVAVRHPLCDARDCVGQPAGTACDDGDACTTDDRCDGLGACVGGAPPACDGACRRCDAALGCVPESPGTACDDGDACTSGDHCDGTSAACVPGGPMSCTAACLIGACDAVLGCVPRPASTLCEDGDACTVSDHCSGIDATCVGGGPRACDGPCLTGLCRAATGCVPRAADTACDDGDACTVADHCSGTDGACVGGGARDCSAPCDSGACSAQDGCVVRAAGSVCRPAGGACELPATCDGATGSCPTNALVAASVVCRAARDACDVAERCTGTAASCPPDAQAAAGTACDDGDPCTVGDRCDGAGACARTAPLACDDGDPCTVDRCTATAGCTSTALAGTAALQCRVGQCTKPALRRKLRRLAARLGRMPRATRHARALTRRLRKLLVRCAIAFPVDVP